jgi:hypothetical protein
MTPISLPPKTIEPNEREVKRFDCTNGNASYCYGCYRMEEDEDGDYVKFEDWQHQKKRIDELECSLQNWIDFSKKWESLCKEKDVEIESLQAKLDHKQRYLDAMDIKGGYAKLESENNALQAQLNVAVDALKRIEQSDGALTITGETAHEALIEIKKIGE